MTESEVTPSGGASPAGDAPGSGLYRAIFERAGLGCAVLDARGGVREVNQALADMLGYSREEMRGLTPAELTHPDDLAAELARFRELLAGERGRYQAEKRYLHRDGHVVWAHLTVTRVGEPQGEPVVLAMVEDVSARHEAEDERVRLAGALRDQQARLSTLVEHVPVGLLLAEAPSGRIVLGNRQAEEILRHPVLPSASVADYGEWVGYHPDGRPVQPHEWPLARALRGEVVRSEECLYRRGDGTHRWIRINAAPIRARDGEVVGGVVTFDDIDAEKRSREGLEFLARSSTLLSSASLETDDALESLARLSIEWLAEGCAIDMARGDGTLERRVSITRDPTLGERIAEVMQRFPPRSDARMATVTAFRSGSSQLISRVEERHLRESSENEEHLAMWRTVGIHSIMAVPLTARGRTLGVITLFRHTGIEGYTAADLALAEELSGRAALAIDNARLFAAERAARNEAEAANRTKSEFLAVMSHELRTPLNAIAGYAELLAMGVYGALEESQREAVRRIQYSQDHLLAQINQILSYARIEAGSVDFRIREVVLAPLVGAVAGLLEPQMAGRSLRFVAPEYDRSLTARADPERVEQILLNLIGNAVKFTPAGGTVSVECEGDAERARIRVSDTGPGIPPEMRERIFDPFVQVDSRWTRAHEGVGLGLSISRNLARAMGGELEVESEPGRGSTFTLTLPR